MVVRRPESQSVPLIKRKPKWNSESSNISDIQNKRKMKGCVDMEEIIDIQREKIRAMVNNLYDMQKMRISCGNRLAASFMELGKKSRERTQESVKAGKEEAEKEANSIISKVMGEYTRISDTFADQATSNKIHTPLNRGCVFYYGGA